MKNLLMLAAVTFLSLPAFGAASLTLSPADEQGIDSTVNAINTTLTAMDFKAFAALLTDDCDFVNVVGMHWVGRDQVAKAHSVIFTTRYHGYPTHVVDKSEALLAKDVALVVVTLKMDDYTARDGKRMTDNLSRMTYVLQKQNGVWLLRSAHNTTIDPEAAKHDPVHAM